MNGKQGVPPASCGGRAVQSLSRLGGSSAYASVLCTRACGAALTIPHVGFPNYQIIANFKTEPILLLLTERRGGLLVLRLPPEL